MDLQKLRALQPYVGQYLFLCGVWASSMTPLQRAQHDVYLRGLFWILRERATNGWPPQDVAKVSCWMTVRMLAALTDRPPRMIAKELIDTALKMEQSEAI